MSCWSFSLARPESMDCFCPLDPLFKTTVETSGNKSGCRIEEDDIPLWALVTIQDLTDDPGVLTGISSLYCLWDCPL